MALLSRAHQTQGGDSHQLTLATVRREEYVRAGIPMLPVTHGVAYTRLQVLLYTVLLAFVTLLPHLTGMSGLFYLAAALMLNVRFLYYAFQLVIRPRPELPMRVFRFSIMYLMWLFVALLADHYLAQGIGLETRRCFGAQALRWSGSTVRRFPQSIIKSTVRYS